MNTEFDKLPQGHEDLTGQQFGDLTVVRFSHINYRHEPLWLCKCSCGCGSVVREAHLKSGHTKTCGHANITLAKRKDGYFPARDHPRLYGVWCAMKSRCYTPSATSYPIYGGRGIEVCEEWKKFPPFCEWALANGYDETAPIGVCTLDRIDVNGNYEPHNCRWVNSETQANNKTNNRYATINGEIDTIANWSRRLGLKRETVTARMHRGQSPEEALSPIPESYATRWERRRENASQLQADS